MTDIYFLFILECAINYYSNKLIFPSLLTDLSQNQIGYFRKAKSARTLLKASYHQPHSYPEGYALFILKKNLVKHVPFLPEYTLSSLPYKQEYLYYPIWE